MTHILRLLLVAALACAGAAAHAQATQHPLSGSGAQQPGADEQEAAAGPFSWMVPKFTMPKITMPKLEMPKMPANALAPVKASAQKVKDGARKAWEGTKEIFTFGHSGEERVASREVPQTTAEWMKQPRPE